MKLTIKNARLAFPTLFEAKAVNGEGEPAFSASLLIDPNDPQVAGIEAAIEKVATEKWGAKTPALLKQMRAADKTALHNGDLKAAYAGFEGMLYVSARSKARPTVVNKDRTPITQGDGLIYAGCYVNAIVEFWAMDNQFGKRVNATLTGVQFVRDGAAFSGGRAAEVDDFEDISVDEDALV
jgi:hypothetical protein